MTLKVVNNLEEQMEFDFDEMLHEAEPQIHQPQERYHEYMKRMLREEDEKSFRKRMLREKDEKDANL